jgi:hypothetical protein
MKLATGLLISALMILRAGGLSASGASQLFSLTLHTIDTPVRAGSDFNLTVTVTNISENNLSFGIAPGAAPDQTMSYNIEVRDAQGREAPPTTFFRNLREHPTLPSGSIFGYTLSPGKSYEEKLAITRLYDLAKPGRYSIQVSRSQKPWPDRADNVKSNRIIILLVNK